MVRLSLSSFLLYLCPALVKIQVIPTISPTVNSKIMNRMLIMPPITADITNVRNVSSPLAAV